MDLRKIKKLIDLLEESNLAELEIREGEETVRLSRIPKGTVTTTSPAASSHPVRVESSPAPAVPATSVGNVGQWCNSFPFATKAPSRPSVRRTQLAPDAIGALRNPRNSLTVKARCGCGTT